MNDVVPDNAAKSLVIAGSIEEEEEEEAVKEWSLTSPFKTKIDCSTQWYDVPDLRYVELGDPPFLHIFNKRMYFLGEKSNIVFIIH